MSAACMRQPKKGSVPVQHDRDSMAGLLAAFGQIIKIHMFFGQTTFMDNQYTLWSFWPLP